MAHDNVRLLNCWLGIGVSEFLGRKFCVDCEFLSTCEEMYVIFAGKRRMHPAYLARKLLRMFEIDSEYLDQDEED